MLNLLATLQLADSFFPSGMFTQSHGLERLVEIGLRGEDQLAALLATYLRHVVGPADALAARWVVRCATADDLETVVSIDARLEATKLASEGRVASRRCGGRILQLGAELYPNGLSARYSQLVRSGHIPGHQAIALALLAASAGLDEQAAALIELHTFSVSLLSAAVRLGILDHIAAQRLLLHAQPIMAEAASTSAASDWQTIGGFAPAIELAQFQHRYALGHMFVS
jgi:urease accessory protein